MDYSITSDQQQAADTFAKVCADKIAPRGKATDAGGVLNRHHWSDLVEVGFFQLF